VLIFDEDALWRLWDVHGAFRPAFVEWGERIIHAMDGPRPEPEDSRDRRLAFFDSDVWIDLGAVQDALLTDGLTQVELLRALLVPHHKDGTTITHIAGAANLPISTTVGALFAPRCERSYSRYVYGERWILTYGPTASTAKMVRSTQLTEDVVRVLCDRHHVRAARFAHEKSALREEAEGLLVGMYPTAVREVLRQRHPDEQLPSVNALQLWRRRNA
jgi:hypothetical protein